jgi:Zn-dependent metalloprotease
MLLAPNPVREERVSTMHKHSPVNCFVPPHILKNIATNGTPAQKNLAIDTLKISAQMRGQRQALADFSAATFRVAAVGKDRVIYDARNGSSLPGTVVRKEGDAPGADVTVNEAYDGSGLTYDLYNNAYQRNSIDANGMRLDSTVHYRKGYDNAFWNGEREPKTSDMDSFNAPGCWKYCSLASNWVTPCVSS